MAALIDPNAASRAEAAPSADDTADTAGEPRKPHLQSVARAAQILLAVGASTVGLSAKELSDLVGTSMPTMYHMTHTLCSVGLLRRDPVTRTYLLGLRIGVLADGLSRHLAVPEELLACVRAAANITGECAYGSGWLNEEIVVLNSVRGTHPIGVAEIPLGQSAAAHARASGKLLLALAPREQSERYLKTHATKRFTKNTLVGAALERELAAIKEQGFAVDNEEHRDGVCCLAVPLEKGRSHVVAIAAPAQRFRLNFDLLLEGLLRAAKSL